MIIRSPMKEWLMRYELQSGSMTPDQWRKEFELFKEKLREFWKSQGVPVGW